MDRLVAVVNWLNGGEHPRLQAGDYEAGYPKIEARTLKVSSLSVWCLHNG